MARGAVLLLRRTRMVGGQTQGRLLITQLFFPILQLTLAFALDAMSHMIESSVREMMGEPPAPQDAEPGGFIQT